jgi:hypothetical protein
MLVVPVLRSIAVLDLKIVRWETTDPASIEWTQHTELAPEVGTLHKRAGSIWTHHRYWPSGRSIFRLIIAVK